MVDIVQLLNSRRRLLSLSSLGAGCLALGISFLLPSIYTARTAFLPPQQQQSIATASLSSLGALAGLAGAGGTLKSPADQYAALMQSTTVEDRIVDRFKLLQTYDKRLKMDARRELEKNTRIAVGKKDGLISVEVDDESPQRAAELANAFVDELRRMTSTLAITEAQQRRVFFEGQLQQTRDNLARAQRDLQASGFSAGALKAEPREAADAYARLKAQAIAAEVRLQTLRSYMNEAAPEVQQAQSALAALKTQIAKAEETEPQGSTADYISKYREFKYQETLFELFSRQYELARVDESREGALVQVVDIATPPERKSRPSRAMIAVTATFITLILMAAFIVIRHIWHISGAAALRRPATP
jgi:uncharacterized protein involved in exopolysaccharide biosynthesis